MSAQRYSDKEYYDGKFNEISDVVLDRALKIFDAKLSHGFWKDCLKMFWEENKKRGDWVIVDGEIVIVPKKEKVIGKDIGVQEIDIDDIDEIDKDEYQINCEKGGYKDYSKSYAYIYWFAKEHFGAGIMVRNVLRKGVEGIGFVGDLGFKDGNLDDYYIQMLEVWIGVRGVGERKLEWRWS